MTGRVVEAVLELSTMQVAGEPHRGWRVRQVLWHGRQSGQVQLAERLRVDPCGCVGAVAASGIGMDAMNRLFSNDFASLRFIRDLGLRLVDRAPPLKNLLIGEAAGAGGGAPKLLRGLSL